MRVDREATAVVALDPGATTGASFISIGPDFVPSVRRWQGQAEEMLGWLSSAISAGVLDRVVIERFMPRRWDNDSVRTVEIVGAVKWICHQGSVPLGEVGAADRNKVMPEVLELEISGNHARDAEAIRIWDLRYGKWLQR